MADTGEPAAARRCNRSPGGLRCDVNLSAQDPETEVLPGTGISDHPHCGNYLPVAIIFQFSSGSACDADRILSPFG